jgi:hypothetical protein
LILLKVIVRTEDFHHLQTKRRVDNINWKKKCPFL